ncbi:MAG: hypothetical protein Q9163_004479 [Psora crenata]
MTAAQPIIYINSWPGVGKHTIAEMIKKQMEGKIRVVHNHHHIDLAGSILPRSSADYLQLRKRLRAVLFDTLATCYETFEHTYIFTDFQTANESGTSVAKEYQHGAERRGCTFVPVVLSCETSENERRMRSPDRVQLVTGVGGGRGKGMLLDTEILKSYRKRGEIYRFEGSAAAAQLELDVTHLSPAQAAAKIIEHVESVTDRSE